MKDSIETPSLGRLIPDEFGDLITLRKFLYFPMFFRGDRETDDADQQLIDDWQTNLDRIVPRAREFDLRAGLHRAGLFEVHVSSDQGNPPSTAQARAFDEFVTIEAQVCRNIVDAMLRYYRSMREALPQFFEDLDDVEFPDNPDADALATVLEFDALHVCHTEVAGISPLIFSWRPAWDEEHGLQALVYAGQVLCVGTDEVRDMEQWPSGNQLRGPWNPSIMTTAEIAAFEDFKFEHPRE